MGAYSHFLLLVSFWVTLSKAQLPTLYEYYTGDGISSGLSVDQPYFTLNGKNITIYSGTIHYFRVHPKHWRDRLKKARAAGLNAVETYVAWNLHEPENGRFDFGQGGTEHQLLLDLEGYLKIAQEEDLFVIIRPGPYICAEWEWGGFPSWLLREYGIQVRTSDPVYLKYVKRYFSVLLPIIERMQFTKGGPIIAVQVENEYGSAPIKDLDYIQALYDNLKDNGIVELLVSSDGAGARSSGTLAGLIFQTVNFGGDPAGSFDILKEIQPDKPFMAMEYWTGWFDHWSESHHTVGNNTFHGIYESILTYPASVNMYMFHGGTNFGFLNGANIQSGDNSGYQPTTTSYDYDAPLSEAGDYTGKYIIVQQLIQQYNPIQTLIPDPPELIPRQAYPTVTITGQLTYPDIIERAPALVVNEFPLTMEKLPINQESGQSYGYLVYRKEKLAIKANSVLTIDGHVRDTVMVLVNGVLISPPLTTSADLDGFGYYRMEDSQITLTTIDLADATLDLVIENWGRGNFGNLYDQHKGLGDDNTVYLDDEELKDWTMFPYEFKRAWTQSLTGWKDPDPSYTGPALYRGVLNIDTYGDYNDTYINMEAWTKGVVVINGFVLGRYATIGPQQTLYLPGPFLQEGDNEIIVFEHFSGASEVPFATDPIFNTH